MAVAEMVNEGGLATVGLNQYHLGVLTGQMVLEIINGADPATLSIEDPKETELILNETQAKRLDIEFDETAIETADVIIEEEG